MSDLKTRLEAVAQHLRANADEYILKQWPDQVAQDEATVREASAEVAQLTAALAQVRTWAETTKDVTGCEPCRQAAWDVLDLLPPAASVPKEQP